ARRALTPIQSRSKTMNKLVSRGLWTVLIAGGLSVAGATAANADTIEVDASLLGSNLANVDIALPINLGGLLGTSQTSAPLIDANVQLLSPTPTTAQPSAPLVDATVNVLSPTPAAAPSTAPVDVKVNILSSSSSPAPSTTAGPLADVDLNILSSGGSTAAVPGQAVDADVQI